MPTETRTGKLRVLDFDIENRPLTYLGQDFTTSDITAIAWSFGGPIECRLLVNDPDGVSQCDMLLDFQSAYDLADIVTGHYIRMHDLPIINGALCEWGLEPLTPKLVSDTKVDLIGFKGVSKSEESLAGMLGIRAPKITITQTDWREANRLTDSGLALTKRRVVADVRQHMKLRAELLERGMLKAPTYWQP